MSKLARVGLGYARPVGYPGMPKEHTRPNSPLASYLNPSSTEDFVYSINHYCF